MRVVTIGSDSSIFVAGSAARERMRAYAHALGEGELHILSTAKPDAREEQDGNLFLHPVHTAKLFRVGALAKRAHALILEKGIDIVSAQDPFEHGLAALRAVQGTSAKLHVQVHTDFLSPWFVKSGSWKMSLLNQYRCRLADRVLPKADGIRVVSERIRASLVARYGTRLPEPSVIPITVESSVPLAEALPEHPFKFVLIAVGRLEAEKRVKDILAALKLVVKQYAMVGLFVVGDGRERHRLERRARSLGLKEHTIFLGDRPGARALMGSANAFIQASAYEGYGRTLIEAALARVPIITTDVGLIGDVLKDQEDALVAPVADPGALARSIERLVEEVTLRQQLAMHAEAAAQAHLAAAGDLPTRIARDWEATLQRSR